MTFSLNKALVYLYWHWLLPYPIYPTLAAFKVYDESQNSYPCSSVGKVFYFLLVSFQIFSLSLVLCSLTMVCLAVFLIYWFYFLGILSFVFFFSVLWRSQIHHLVSVITSRKFSDYFLKYFFCPILFSLLVFQL